MKNPYVLAFFTIAALASWFGLEEFTIRSYVALLFGFFAFQVLLNDLLESYLIKKLKAKYFNFLIAPGTAVHEASHALVAKATGCDITKVSFFNPSQKNGVLGFVEYMQPVDRFQSMRSLVIGLAPFFGCGIFLIALLNYLALEHPGMQQIGPDLVDVGDISAMASTITLILAKLYQQLLYVNLADPAMILILYLEFSFALGSAPSPQDISDSFNTMLKYKLEALSMVLFVISAILLIEYGPGLSDYGSIVSANAILAFKWTILLLMLSSAMLLIAIPLTLLITETVEIKGVYKILPAALFVAIYFAARQFLDVPVETILIASGFVYVLSLFVLRHQEYFLNERTTNF